jgi:hypothetical protein
VVGGQDPTGQIRQTAAAYDPTTNVWRTLASPPQMPPNPIVVWTGSRLLVVGGGGYDHTMLSGIVWTYDPIADSWTSWSPITSFVTDRSPWVWTDHELLAWGTDQTGRSGSAWAFDPIAGTTRPLPTPPIEYREQAATAWTGTEWIIWGGYSTTDLADGAAYNPTTNTWRTLAAAPLSGRRSHAVWTGSEVLIAAGASSGNAETGNGVFANSDGAAYDPTTDTWRKLRDGFAHPGFIPVWNGRVMVLFAKGGAVVYDPATDTWTDSCCGLTLGGTPVWTGSQIILIGSSDPALGGEVFTPPD